MLIRTVMSLGLIICLINGVFAAEVTFTSSNLPIIFIDTGGQSIRDGRRTVAEMGVIDNGSGERNYVSDSKNNYSGQIAIELRGSSSLQFPKKQYRFETQDTSGNNLNVSLLDMPDENDWILYAPFSDRSLMRNVLAYKLANDLGEYAPRTRFVELVLNEEYMGVYVLMEKIKRDRNRINIAEMDTLDNTGDALTGGYIIKVDKTAGETNSGWTSIYPPYEGTNSKTYYQYHYPRPADITDAQKEYIRDYFNGFEELMASSGYQHPDTGYARYLNTDSFIDYIIVNEVSKNVDGYRLSAFMYKDRDSRNGKLTMGPVWDYNLAFGNADYYTAYNPAGFILEYFLNDEEFHQSDQFQVPFWWRQLMNDPLFKNRLYKRYWELRQQELDVGRILTYINSTANLLEEAQQRNFQKWEIFGMYVWPNAYIGVNYEDEMDYLKSWIQDRIEWLDDNIYQIYTGIEHAQPGIIPGKFTLGQNYPNPFNSGTVIQYTIIGANNYSPLQIDLSIYNLLGQKVATLVNKEQAAGSYQVHWDGKDQFNKSVPSGVYIYRLQTNNYSSCKKMLYIQ